MSNDNRTPGDGDARPSIIARNTQAVNTAAGLAEGSVRRIGRTWVLGLYIALRNLK